MRTPPGAVVTCQCVLVNSSVASEIGQKIFLVDGLGRKTPKINQLVKHKILHPYNVRKDTFRSLVIKYFVALNGVK